MYDQLTNAHLRGLFKNNFELAKYAIRLGKYYVKSGREVTLDGILEEVLEHPQEDYVDTLLQIDESESKSGEEGAG